MLFRTIVAAVAAVASVAHAEVITGNAANFEETVKTSAISLVKFYAPWCGHCKRLAPEFETAAVDLKGIAALIDVDCTADENRELCGKFEVQGYPTLKMFRGDPTRSIEYEGPREAAGIIKYMRKQTQEPYTILHTVKDIKSFQNNVELGLLVYVEKDSAEFKTIADVAFTFRNDYDFGIVTDKDFFGDISVPHATFFKTFDEPTIVYDGEFTRASLETFLSLEAFPLVGEIGPENYAKYIDRGLPLAWVFYGKDDASKAALDAVQTVATEFKGRISFVKLDGHRWAQHAKSMGVEGTPGLCIQQGKKDYILENEFTAENVKAHCEAMLNGSIQPKLKSEEIPEDNSGPVTIIVGKNFEEIVFDENKDVFVKFYAPWCGHCKSLAPKYEVLGEKFVAAEHIIIGKIDATENDTPADITGFPTLIYYPAGDREGMVYNGERSEAAMAEFIEANAVASVKMAMKGEL